MKYFLIFTCLSVVACNVDDGSIIGEECTSSSDASSSSSSSSTGSGEAATKKSSDVVEGLPASTKKTSDAASCGICQPYQECGYTYPNEQYGYPVVGEAHQCGGGCTTVSDVLIDKATGHHCGGKSLVCSGPGDGEDMGGCIPFGLPHHGAYPFCCG